MDFHEAIYNLYSSKEKNINVFLECTFISTGNYKVSIQVGGMVIIKGYILGCGVIVGPEHENMRVRQPYYLKRKVIKDPLKLTINEVNTENLYSISILENNIEIMYIHIKRTI